MVSTETETETETETGGAAGRPPRPLSRREYDVLVALITRGTHGEDETVTDQDRARWLEQVAHPRRARLQLRCLPFHRADGC